jgi:hypothetical protein
MPELDAEGLCTLQSLPRCACGLLMRPNVCFFSDLYWVPTRTKAAYARLEKVSKIRIYLFFLFFLVRFEKRRKQRR